MQAQMRLYIKSRELENQYSLQNNLKSKEVSVDNSQQFTQFTDNRKLQTESLLQESQQSNNNIARTVSIQNRILNKNNSEQYFKINVPKNGYERFTAEKYSNRYAQKLQKTITQIFEPSSQIIQSNSQGLISSNSQQTLNSLLKEYENPGIGLRIFKLIDEKSKEQKIGTSMKKAQLRQGLNSQSMMNLLQDYVVQAKAQTIPRQQSHKNYFYGPNIYTYQDIVMNQNQTNEKKGKIVKPKTQKSNTKSQVFSGCPNFVGDDDIQQQFSSFTQTKSVVNLSKQTDRDKTSYLKTLAEKLKGELAKKQERKLKILMRVEIEPLNQTPPDPFTILPSIVQNNPKDSKEPWKQLQSTIAKIDSELMEETKSRAQTQFLKVRNERDKLMQQQVEQRVRQLKSSKSGI